MTDGDFDQLFDAGLPDYLVNRDQDDDRLILELDGFEGPLDLLLTLARTQKVDLTEISILDLVDQYLVYINKAREIRIEVAADYLVMAAWLADLKSRLLLPREEDDEEPSAEEQALRLQLRLQRLDAMREVGARLMARDRLGRDVFTRGAPEGLTIHKTGHFDLTLYELLRAYGEVQQKASLSHITIERRPVFALEDAIKRLESLVGRTLDWSELVSFLPKGLKDRRLIRSAIASHFAASLELAKAGVADLRQDQTFAPIQVRRRLKDSLAEQEEGMS